MYKTLNQIESVSDWGDVLFIGFHDLATGEVIGLGMTKGRAALSFASVAGQENSRPLPPREFSHTVFSP
jgi:hypothetical protein